MTTILARSPSSLALAAAAPRHQDAGRAVGAVYAANTVGAIVGALTFSMIVIPTVGTQWAERILMAVAALAAMLMLVSRPRAGVPADGRRMPAIARMAGAAAVPIAAAVLALGVPKVPGELFAFGRKVMAPEFELNMLYVGEGLRHLNGPEG